ncbi:MAG: cytochrome-c peroxidase [Proteobacteria bacterium]|nr:MAG: cytochrome-c peroxidase [Pseudomonadota bacterium]
MMETIKPIRVTQDHLGHKPWLKSKSLFWISSLLLFAAVLSFFGTNSANNASGQTVSATVTEKASTAGAFHNDAGAVISWSDAERALLKTLSLSNLPKVPLDPSNQYIGNPDAIAFGQQLFFDPGLSQTGTVSCSSCHQPQRHFSDGMQVASGIKPGTRNTPSLLGSAYQQWFFWDGRKDSAWSQALEPFENPNEHNLTRIEVIQKVLGDKHYYPRYQAIFADAPTAEVFATWPSDATPKGDINSLKKWKSLSLESRQQINRIYANIGKSIAAFEATLKFPESRFDQFVQQLSLMDQQANDNAAAGSNEKPALSMTEQQGLKLFLGKASCVSCHHSALLSSQHFQNIGTGVRGKDMGRSQVAEAQAWDEFNCLGAYSDAPKEACKNLKFMSKNRHELAGNFKVPTLRNIAKTAPYMHDGRFKTLQEVVGFYVNPPSQRLTGHHLPKIDLNDKEVSQLIAFLKAL